MPEAAFFLDHVREKHRPLAVRCLSRGCVESFDHTRQFVGRFCAMSRYVVLEGSILRHESKFWLEGGTFDQNLVSSSVFVRHVTV